MGGVWIGSESELITVSANWHGSPLPARGNRDDDPIDVGFLELTRTQQEAFVGCHWFEPSDLAFTSPREGDAYVAIGYPWRKAKADHSNRNLDLTAFGYSDVGLPVEPYSRFG